MVIITLLGIFFRYCLNDALSWTEELTRYMMVFIGLMGAALAIWEDKHVAFSLLVEKLPLNLQKILKVFCYLLIEIFIGTIVYYGYNLAVLSGAHAEILPIPMTIPLFILPISGLVMFIILMVKIWLEIEGNK